MVKKIFVVLAFFLMISMAVALDGEITVKTLAENKVSVRITKADDLLFIESFHKMPDSNGVFSESFSTMYPEVDVDLKLLKDGEEIYREKHGPFKTNEPILIDLVTPDEPEPEVNETPEEPEPTPEPEPEPEPVAEVEDAPVDAGEEITGKSFVDITTGKVARVIYIIIGLVLIVGFVFFFLVNKKSRGETIKKLSTQRLEDAEGKVREAEEELKKAQEEIRQIKEEDGEILEAEKQFKEAEDRLKKLRSEHKELKEKHEKVMKEVKETESVAQEAPKEEPKPEAPKSE